jgi:DNA-binding HxlR family transcriptional regulator
MECYDFGSRILLLKSKRKCRSIPMPLPKPGAPVRGSTSGRPIMALLDLLGRRWVLRIIWELREETLNFRGLQERCDSMSPSVLNQRLGELREAGTVELVSQGYRLTAEGKRLFEALAPLHHWAQRWAKRERVRGRGKVGSVST